MSEQPLPLYKAADVTAMDRMAIDDLGISAYLLMTRAAQAALNRLAEHFERAKSVLVLCGAGNNAGDGYVLARLAVDRGYRVTLCDVVPARSLTGTAHTAYQDFVTGGGVCTRYDNALINAHDVVVDGLLGTGLSRDVSGVFKQVITDVNSSGAPVLSLDVPSGLACDSGLPMPVAIKADITVTFVARKHGLYTGYGAHYCGKRFLETLSIPPSVALKFPPSAYLISDREVCQTLPPRCADTHKGQCGRVLLVGGGSGMAGAAVLAGSAALRVGAGLVKVVCSPESAGSVVNQRPELMTKSVAHADDVDQIEQAKQIEQVIEWCDVIAIGPGLGRDHWAQSLFKACIKANKPTVIDADALHLLAKLSCGTDEERNTTNATTDHRVPSKAPQKTEKQVPGSSSFNAPGLRSRVASTLTATDKSDASHAQSIQAFDTIITPHVGEAAALLGVSTQQICTNREMACQALASQYNCVAILKGAGTVVCNEASSLFFCEDGNPGMATAGTGDVLTGVIAGIWAQQSERTALAMEVALAAVKVHAQSGDRAAKNGMRGMIASDLIGQLRTVVNER